MLTGLATWFVRKGRRMGRLLGRELVVEQSDHSLTLSMEKPDNDRRAWDNDQFTRGQLYRRGYANPVKIEVDHNPGIGNKDTVAVADGDGTATATEFSDEEEQPEALEEDRSVEVIASERYRQFMEQDLISQLLNPKEQWEKLVYGLIGIGSLQFLSIVVTLWATGSF